MKYADLELGLFYRDVGRYAAELRFTSPGSEVDYKKRFKSLISFDEEKLSESNLNGDAHGRILSESLFKDPDLKATFKQAISHTQGQKFGIRMRLFIGPNALQLHNYRWETLRDPDDDKPIFTTENILFSRYLSSNDWRPVSPRTRGDLRGLIAIANPTDLDKYKPHGRHLLPIDTSTELTFAKTAMEGVALDELVLPGMATLEGIFEALKSKYDFLYLMCHGALIDGISYLWLEDKEGLSHKVRGSKLADRLVELENVPRLIVLASCQSGGTGDHNASGDMGALSALGPQMAACGTPAVVAMQGSISTKTVAKFMPLFFKELLEDGQVDRAMSIARRAIEDQPDCWMPALYMRMKSGRLWISSGSTNSLQTKWLTVRKQIKSRMITPILGPGLIEHLIGSRREIAQRWARTFHFPLASHLCEDLPQVAQFLAIKEKRFFVTSNLVDFAKSEIQKRYGSLLDDSVDRDSLDGMVSVIGSKMRERDEDDPHKVLARFELPIYITTNFNNLMADALRDYGKHPVVEICKWKEELETLPSIFDEEPDYQPSKERPFVYHLLGRLSEAKTLVITQDDYFDFLIGTSRNQENIPDFIQTALVDRGLLLIGFQLNDWEFRVIFRSILSSPSAALLKDYEHVAAQIDPEAEYILEPEGARQYLETYFSKSAGVSIYWGDAYQFAAELRRQSEIS